MIRKITFCLIALLIACGPGEKQEKKVSNEKTEIVKKKKQKAPLNKYWSTVQKDLKLSDTQINRLRRIRRTYNTNLKKGSIAKEKLMEARKKKEADVLRSNKAVKQFNEFNKSWNRKNGK